LAKASRIWAAQRTAATADTGRQLVGDQLAETLAENWRTVDQSTHGTIGCCWQRAI